MLNHVSVIRRTQTELVLNRSKMKAVVELCFTTLFFALWYSALIDDFSSFESVKNEVSGRISEQKFLIIFYLAPLLSFNRVLLCLTTIVLGNVHRFNSMSRKIFHNKRPVCNYSEIGSVQIRRINDSDGDDSFRLTLRYGDGKKLFIARGTDQSYIEDLAADIANICDTKIVYKN